MCFLKRKFVRQLQVRREAHEFDIDQRDTHTNHYTPARASRHNI